MPHNLPALSMTAGSVVAVVGAGASGTLAAIHLAAAAGRADRRIDLVLVDDPPVGRGIAYSTSDRRHRLNVPAGRMSAWPDDPTHFLRWLVTHTDRRPTASTFAARATTAGTCRDPRPTPSRHTARVHLEFARTGHRADPHGRRLRLRPRLRRAAVPVDAAVLAIGNGAPSTAWAPAELARSAAFVADPWAAALRDVADRRRRCCWSGRA